MYFRRKTSAGRAYLQIVESRRDGDQVRQQAIATLLGRFELQAGSQLERTDAFGCALCGQRPSRVVLKLRPAMIPLIKVAVCPHRAGAGISIGCGRRPAAGR